MTNPLPTSPEVRSAVESLVYREASYATIDAIRDAQHAATRKATLEEVRAMIDALSEEHVAVIASPELLKRSAAVAAFANALKAKMEAP